MEKLKVLLDKRMKYKGSLPCPACGGSLLHGCIKNEVKYVQGPKAKPREILNADLYKCSTCKILVLTDFGMVPQWNAKTVIAPGLQELIDSWTTHNAGSAGTPSDPGHRIVIVYSWQFNAGVSTSDILPDELMAYIAVREQRIRETEKAFSKLLAGRDAA